MSVEWLAFLWSPCSELPLALRSVAHVLQDHICAMSNLSQLSKNFHVSYWVRLCWSEQVGQLEAVSEHRLPQGPGHREALRRKSFLDCTKGPRWPRQDVCAGVCWEKWSTALTNLWTAVLEVVVKERMNAGTGPIFIFCWLYRARKKLVCRFPQENLPQWILSSQWWPNTEPQTRRWGFL